MSKAGVIVFLSLGALILFSFAGNRARIATPPLVSANRLETLGRDEAAEPIPIELIDVQYVDSSEREFKAVLQRKISFEFQKTPLNDVLKVLSSRVGAPFVLELDSDDLAEESGDKSDSKSIAEQVIKISAVAKDLPVRRTLVQVFDRAGLQTRLRFGQVVVKKQKYGEWFDHPVTRAYPVGDFLAFRTDDAVPSVREELIDLVKSSIENPIENRPPSIQVDMVGMLLIVDGVFPVHEEIEELLSKLREIRHRNPTLLRAAGGASVQSLRTIQNLDARAASNLCQLEMKMQTRATPGATDAGAIQQPNQRRTPHRDARQDVSVNARQIAERALETAICLEVLAAQRKRDRDTKAKPEQP